MELYFDSSKGNITFHNDTHHLNQSSKHFDESLMPDRKKNGFKRKKQNTLYGIILIIAAIFIYTVEILMYKVAKNDFKIFTFEMQYYA